MADGGAIADINLQRRHPRWCWRVSGPWIVPSKSPVLLTLHRRGVLKRGKKSVPEQQFFTKTACGSYVQLWLVAIGGWRLVAVGCRARSKSTDQLYEAR